MARGPQILAVEAASAWDTHLYEIRGEKPYSVYITLRQLKRLPQWMWDHINWVHCHENSTHCYVVISAKDELQAAMRFNKLWAGLPKE
jgi:hypothetical protein